MGFIALRCPSCGAEIELDDSRDFAFCSYCGTKMVREKQTVEHNVNIRINHDTGWAVDKLTQDPTIPSVKDKDKKKIKTSCAIALIVVFVVIFIIIAVMSLGSDSSSSANETNSNQNTSQQNGKVQTIYEDKYIKANLIKIYDEDSVSGVVYLQMFVENKSNESLTVFLSDASVNNLSVTTGSGVPMIISPGNASQQPFAIFTKNANINSADEVNKLQFRFSIMDEETDILEETKLITINMK